VDQEDTQKLRHEVYGTANRKTIEKANSVDKHIALDCQTTSLTID
jgi:hypothetical protein